MLATIPSPTEGVLWLGPIPLRGYALCILAGVVVATIIAGRRLEARGYERDAAVGVVLWIVPFGIVGGRLYHVITTPQPYFGDNGNPVDALKVWQGGLGIWGAVALGALGAWIGARREGVPFAVLADAIAPGLPLAQAIGRFGNYFNNELYGRRTDVPWALEIHQWDSGAGKAVVDSTGQPVVLGTFHPTFLYEALWCLLIAFVIWRISDSGRLRRGQAFGLYVMLYPMGRIIVELMRSDFANRILGLRVNVWVSILVFLLGLGIFLARRKADPDVRLARAGDDSDRRADDGVSTASSDTSETATSDEATCTTKDSKD
ncbi:prolipoprotein diacylglyceryl transferase [Dermacoccus abyssi]|uniref:Phosphatidylglycerol--prolipoprotein diacylglyceryl transferase n=1 Tax=Dermacoccus abyssi TaxID=322596 RepID=A0ABX5Z8Q1_9MICO|nr:prolipoprotein diacylglyceryl transferase [Dermacoccus abyssi]